MISLKSFFGASTRSNASLATVLGFAAAAALATGACRSSDPATTDAPPANPADAHLNGDGMVITPTVDAANVGVKTIYEIQNPDNSVPTGSIVEVDNVVVTAIDTYGSRTGAIWVEEVNGGPYSGVQVFGAPTAQASLLSVGDIVKITGAAKAEFALATDTSGKTDTELEKPTGGAITITKTGTGTVPAPMTLDATAIAAMSQPDQDTQWRMWEGVLVTVTHAQLTSAPKSFSTTDATEFTVDLTGELEMESTLSAFPTTGSFVVEDCLTSVTGIVDYFFNYLILPRATADIVEGGTGCPTPTSATAAGIQGGTDTGLVSLTNVFVTAISNNGADLWVADSLTAAANNGVYAFVGGSTALPTGVVVGAKVNVIGTVSEFGGTTPVTGNNTITEVGHAVVSFVAAPTTAPTPIVEPLATVASLTAGEPYEGVLVQMNNVKCTVVTPPTLYTLSDGTNTIVTSDFAFPTGTGTLPLTVNTCYASITGISDGNFTTNTRTLGIRSAADVVAGGTCN